MAVIAITPSAEGGLRKSRALLSRLIPLIIAILSATVPVLGGRSAQTDFGSAQIGGTPPVNTLTFSITSTGTLVAIDVLTQGSVGLDFTDTGQGTCTLGHLYTVGDSCSVSVQFSPLQSGLRLGAVQIAVSGRAPQTTYIHGVGYGPQIQFTPGLAATAAGNGKSGFGGDGHAAVRATFNDPIDVAVANGNVYIADSSNNRIREVNNAGNITTIVGSGTYGFTGDYGPAAVAAMRTPVAVVLDGAGFIYVLDYSNQRLRRIDSTGIITTICGTGTAGYNGDGIPASAAQIDYALDLAVDGSGNVYIADTDNSRIRKIDPSGTITTVAGTGQADFGGDGGPASKAFLDHPSGLSVDASGNLYIADTYNNRIRRVDPNGTITTIAGTGADDYSGDGGSAIDATLSYPIGVTTDPAGDVYISDLGNDCIREVSTSGAISTILGGPASAVSLSGPSGVAFSGADKLFLADSYNELVRVIEAAPPSFSYRSQQVSTSSSPQLATVSNNNATAIVLTGIAISPDFQQIPTGVNDCSASVALSPGDQCVLALAFIPTKQGSISGSATITSENPEGGPSVSAQIMLVGTGVGNAAESISWATPASIIFGSRLGATQLNAAVVDASGKAVPGTYSYSPDAGTLLNSGKQTLSVVFTPSNDLLASLTDSVTVMVSQAVPSLHWSVLSPITYGTPLSSSQLAASATGVDGQPLQGTFAYTPDDGTLPSAGLVPVQVVFVAADSTNYTVATQSNSIQVLRAQPLIQWAQPIPLSYGTALSAIQLNASANGINGQPLPGSFSYSPSAGTILPSGLQVLSVKFTPIDSTDYVPIGQTTTLQVGLVSALLTWRVPSSIIYGTPLSSLQLNATASDPQGHTLEGSFSYDPPLGTTLAAGQHLLSVAFSPSSTNDKSASATVSLIVERALSSLRISSPRQDPTSGQVVLTAHVTGGAASPIGTVRFMSGQTMLATVPLSSDATAAYTWKGLVDGTAVIVAQYSGDTNYVGSESELTLSDTTPPPSFSLTAARSAVSLNRGETGTVGLTLTPVNGFSGTVMLSTTGLPEYSTVTLSPSTWKSDGSLQSVTLTVGTEVPLAGYRASSIDPENAGFCSILSAIGSFYLLAIRRRSKKCIRYLLLAILIAPLSSFLTGCGVSPFKSSPGSYDLAVSAISTDPSVPTQTIHLSVTLK